TGRCRRERASAPRLRPGVLPASCGRPAPVPGVVLVRGALPLRASRRRRVVGRGPPGAAWGRGVTATVHPLRRLPRTEQEAMAAAVARLLDVGLLPRNAPTIRKAADSLGIPVDSIRDAWREL